MNVIPTAIAGVFIIEQKVFQDHRGYFLESYHQDKFQKLIGANINFIQDNHSSSTYGVLRGLHYQKSPYAQAKLIRVTAGEVQDVVVDIRKGSPTYGKYVSVVLSESNHRQIFVPRGFAHGFLVLSKVATLQYKCDNFYTPEADKSIIYNDPVIDISWKVPQDKILLSDKDQNAPTLALADNNFIYTEGK